MEQPDFRTVFRIEAGKLYWTNPPRGHAEKAGAEAGYICRGSQRGGKDYWQVRAFGRTFKRSRVIFHMTHGRWPNPCVDHINGNSLDDRPENLREATHSQNSANRPWPKKSGMPLGVSQTRQGRFMARVGMKSIGTFDTKEEAAATVLSARKEVFGDFA